MTESTRIAEHLLTELAEPMSDHSGCDVTVETRYRPAAVEGVYHARLTLKVDYPVVLSDQVLSDPTSIHEWVDDVAKSFRERLKRASDAALAAWAKELHL